MTSPVCPLCTGIDAPGEHGCHCISLSGKRFAVGICCGHMLGAGMLADEIAADERWAAREAALAAGVSPELANFAARSEETWAAFCDGWRREMSGMSEAAAVALQAAHEAPRKPAR